MPTLCALLLGVLAIAGLIGSAFADEVAQRPAGKPPAAGTAAAAARGSVETVHFANRGQAAVTLVRGPAGIATLPGQREVVTFGGGRAARVTVVRGIVEPEPGAAAPVRQAALASPTRVETVSFGDRARSAVTVVRGAGLRERLAADLFAPANPGDLDRIAVAVHGAESSYGRDPRMWRPDFAGPQGPMQVSLAAALDIGGGNRFDVYENMQLGRAYLARMFRRYGNWPDALAAYNWGPGNVDRWIAGGRLADRLPLETARYLERVLRDALIAGTAATLQRGLSQR